MPDRRQVLHLRRHYLTARDPIGTDNPNTLIRWAVSCRLAPAAVIPSRCAIMTARPTTRLARSSTLVDAIGRALSTWRYAQWKHRPPQREFASLSTTRSRSSEVIRLVNKYSNNADGAVFDADLGRGEIRPARHGRVRYVALSACGCPSHGVTYAGLRAGQRFRSVASRTKLPRAVSAKCSTSRKYSLFMPELAASLPLSATDVEHCAICFKSPGMQDAFA